MPNQPKKSQPDPDQVLDGEIVINGGIELIDLCSQAFHAKLSELEKRFKAASDQPQKETLRQEAENLYLEYEKTIKTIEDNIKKINTNSK